MSEFQGKAYPVKNTGTEEIPPWGLVLLHDGDQANEFNPLVEYRVINTKGNDQENEDGTFQNVFHYHNRLGFNCGARINPNGHGQAYFRLSGPIVAALESDDVTESDMLVATTDSAVLRKLDAGEPGTPGDYTNIFGLFRPLHKLSKKRWLVMHIKNPLFVCKVAEDADGTPCVAEILQHGDEDNGSIDVAITPARTITFFAKNAVSKDDQIMVGLVAGALIQIGGGTVAGGSTGGASGIVANYGCGCASCLDKGVIEDSANVDEAAEFYTLFFSEKLGDQNRFQLVYDPEEDSSDFWESDDIEINILRGDWPVQKYRFRLTFDGDPKITETVNLILYRVAGTGEPDRISSLPSGSTSPIASWTNSKFQDILCAFALDRHTRVDPDLRMTFSGACVVCVTPELSNVSTTCIAAQSSGQFFWKNGNWATGYRIDLNGIPTNTPKDSVVDCKVCLKAAQLLDEKLPLTISWNGVDHSGSVAWIPDGSSYFEYPCSGGNTTSRTTLSMSLTCLGTGAIGAPSGHSAAELFIEWVFLQKGSTSHSPRFRRYYYRAYSNTANPIDMRSGPVTFTHYGASLSGMTDSVFYCDTITSGKSDTWPESITITPVF